MSKVYEGIDDALTEWIKNQHVFFVATSPLAAEGLINLSPKGLDTFRVIGPHTVAYADLTGSGIETIAHLRENGRIVIMFCAFDGPPKILRLYGRGQVLEPGSEAYEALRSGFCMHPGLRAIVRVDVARIADSCGYAVPLLEYKGDRDVLDKWTENKGADGLRSYWKQKNERSLDGLPGIKR